MGRTVKIGMLGCGKIAHMDHVPGLLGVKGMKITALCDPDPAQAEKLARAFNLDAARYADEKAFFDADIDAVVVCTPNRLHLPQTLAALRAGLHVLCEKPMAATSAEASRMVAAAAKAGRVLQINHTMHYYPAFQTLAALAGGGAVGRIIHVRCLRAGGETPDVGWSPGASWFVSRAWQGGIILDIGVHMAEMMRWAAGPVREIAAITGTRKAGIDVPDNASALMRFESGATGVLELSWTIPCGGMFLEVYGETGTLRMGFDGKHPIELIRPGRRGGTPKTTWPKVPARAKNSQQCFYEAVTGIAPSPTPGTLGREAIALCEAITRSGETGKFVRVKQF